MFLKKEYENQMKHIFMYFEKTFLPYLICLIGSISKKIVLIIS